MRRHGFAPFYISLRTWIEADAVAGPNFDRGVGCAADALAGQSADRLANGVRHGTSFLRMSCSYAALAVMAAAAGAGFGCSGDRPVRGEVNLQTPPVEPSLRSPDADVAVRPNMPPPGRPDLGPVPPAVARA